jgi:hypothetical protein
VLRSFGEDLKNIADELEAPPKPGDTTHRFMGGLVTLKSRVPARPGLVHPSKAICGVRLEVITDRDATRDRVGRGVCISAKPKCKGPPGCAC